MAARWNSSRAPERPRTHTLETVVRLQVRKAHLDLLALVLGFGELQCTHQGARCIPCILMHVARDLSKGHIRVHLGLSGHGPQSRVLAR
jgi:hypothetical protein